MAGSSPVRENDADVQKFAAEHQTRTCSMWALAGTYHRAGDLVDTMTQGWCGALIFGYSAAASIASKMSASVSFCQSGRSSQSAT